MRDSELRGLILEALYNQRRKDLVILDQELGELPVSHGATESILRQLVKKGLLERPVQPLSGLGTGRITAYGIDVVQGTTSPPLSILLHQRITVQDEQLGQGNIQNVSDTKLNVPMDHSEASQDKPKSFFERISKWWKHILKKSESS
jgi:DNA-binding PadR family transcriptional regulator